MFDLIVIGGGPAGYHAAAYAADRGLRVACIEREAVGGECLNRGCIPTKTLLSFEKELEHIRFLSGQGGLICGTPQVDHGAVIRYKDEVVKALTGGVKATLQNKQVALLHGEASLEGVDGGFIVRGGGEAHGAKYVLLATGSKPVIPPIPGLDACLADGSAVTSARLLEEASLCKRLLIVGAGVIGLEFGAYFAGLGVKVAMVEALGHVGGDLDGDVEKYLRRQLRQKKIDLYLESRLARLEGKTAVLQSAKGETAVEFDRLLLCVGRRPELDLAGLRELGVAVEGGAVVTDACGRTNVPGLYAAGDVNGRAMLAHAAYREAEAAVNDILGHEDPVDYAAVPRILYLKPEVACVGLSEAEAAARGIPYTVKKQSINYSGRHMAENGPSTGFCKLVIDKEKDVLLGAALCAAYASEIAFSLAMMIQFKLPLRTVLQAMFPHPTVCEIIKETLLLPD